MGRNAEFSAGLNTEPEQPETGLPKTSEAYAQQAGYTSQAEMRAEDW